MQHPSRPLLHTLCSTLLTPLQEVTDWSAARVAGAACRCALWLSSASSLRRGILCPHAPLSARRGQWAIARAWISRVNGNNSSPRAPTPLAPKVPRLTPGTRPRLALNRHTTAFATTTTVSLASSSPCRPRPVRHFHHDLNARVPACGIPASRTGEPPAGDWTLGHGTPWVCPKRRVSGAYTD